MAGVVLEVVGEAHDPAVVEVHLETVGRDVHEARDLQGDLGSFVRRFPCPAPPEGRQAHGLDDSGRLLLLLRSRRVRRRREPERPARRRGVADRRAGGQEEDGLRGRERGTSNLDGRPVVLTPMRRCTAIAKAGLRWLGTSSLHNSCERGGSLW